MIYFTSDLHIGHDKEFIWGARGFKNIEEHDTAILKRWNSIIKDEDTVFILGDLALGQDTHEWDRIFHHLKGDKHFIIGNHDTDNKVKKFESEYDIICCGYIYVFKNAKWHFYCSHYPTITTNFDDTKSSPLINLFGHTHQKIKFFNDNPYMYNVGMDAHDCYPVSIGQIKVDIMEKKDEINRKCF